MEPEEIPLEWDRGTTAHSTSDTNTSDKSGTRPMHTNPVLFPSRTRTGL